MDLYALINDMKGYRGCRLLVVYVVLLILSSVLHVDGVTPAPVTCPDPGSITDGDTSPAGPYNEGDTITHSCITGYQVASGTAFRTCTSAGTWDGSIITCTMITCTPASVPNSSKSPDQASYNYGASVTYACDTGYENTGGNLDRTCQTGSVWSGTTPACTMITCTPASVPNSSKSPDQASYNYGESVTYACDTGYENTGGNLSRTCQTGSVWSGTTPACTMITCTPASVPNSSKSPDQASYNYGASVTYACDTGYENTGGNLDRTCQTGSVWSGTTPACTMITCTPASVPNSSKSPDQASYNYDTIVTYACDTGYEHTSGDLVRICQVGSAWNGTTPTCTIKTCIPASVPNSSKSPDQASYNYNTIVTYACDTGYENTGGSLDRTCQADETWTGTLPACTLKTCAATASVPNSSKSQDDPSSDYNTSVTYACDVGYEHSGGSLVRTCLADTSWSGAAPSCALVTCPDVNVPNSSKSPNQISYDYASNVTYACDTHYELTSGDLTRTCQADSSWNGTIPICSIKTCNAIVVPNSSRDPNTATYNYNTGVTYACDTGYEYSTGNLVRTCQADKTWDGTTPTCTIKTCNEEVVPNASKLPDQTDYNYLTNVTYSCNTGYELTGGDLTRTCQADTSWSDTTPVCTAITCTEPGDGTYCEKSPVKALYSYMENVTYSCITGYERASGYRIMICNQQQSNHWTGRPLKCTIKQCDPIVIADGSYDPIQAKFDYDTNITYSCDLGFNHTGGDLVRTCDASASWTNTLPTCTVAACLPIDVVSGSYSPPQPTFEFHTAINYTCDVGYYRNSGDETRTCQTDGTWTGTIPTCNLVRCAASNISYGEYIPINDPNLHDYSTSITYTCDLAYNHTAGNLTRTCQQEFTWSGDTPVCTVAACIQENSTYMTSVPDQLLYNFGDIINYTCILGYNQSVGDLTRTCTDTGQWNGTLPECIIVTCDIPPAPAHASISPAGLEVNYDTNITYSCDFGYNRTSGDEIRRCTEDESFEGVEANCTLITCPSPDVVAHASYLPMPANGEHDFDTSVHFTCDIGYIYDSGDMNRTCNEFAQWTGVLGVCIIIKCTKPTEAFATFLPDTPLYDFNTTVTATCILGYNRTDGDETRTCQHTATWDGTPPNCTIVECDAPALLPNHTTITSTVQSRYVYLDYITYECVLGYELTGGDDNRTCTETADWAEDAPICTIIRCQPPLLGTRTTYAPVQVDYIWKTTVDYTCDVGYNYSTGNMSATCQHDKAWNGTLPVCTVVTCDKIDVPFMTFSPPTNDTHDFNTTIEYSCVLGYNHSYGDLTRTCNYTGEWTNTLPNCTIITCDPPPYIMNTEYTPILVEHDWNTAIDYDCVPGWHYDSGPLQNTCNESGSFPTLDLHCDTKHFLTLQSNEPALSWLNSSVTSVTVGYDFDGIGDFTLNTWPSGLTVSHVLNGTEVLLTVDSTSTTNFNEYKVTLDPFQEHRTFTRKKRNVFYGHAIQDFQATLDHHMIYLAVGDTYHFEATATDGHEIDLEWDMESGITPKTTYDDLFTYGDLNYAFNNPKKNISVTATNWVSTATAVVHVEVIYRPNSFTFEVDSKLTDTTSLVDYRLQLPNTTDLPMHDVDIVINYNHGTGDSETRTLDETTSLPLTYTYSHLFNMQGYFEVIATLTNLVGSQELSINMSVWDKLNTFQLELVGGDYLVVTNDTVQLQFTNPPNFGYKYFIKYGDGWTDMVIDDSIMYSPYNLTIFTHVYTQAGLYEITWEGWNGHYNTSGRIDMIVQNRVPLANYTVEPSGQKYPWINLQTIPMSVNITLEDHVPLPTNATCVFNADDGTPEVTDILYNSSYVEHFHLYLIEGQFLSTLNCSNLVSQHLYQFNLSVVKYLPEYLTVVYAPLVPLNVSDSVTMYFHIDSGGFALIPFNISLVWRYGDGTGFEQLDYDTSPYTHVYNARGDYEFKLIVRSEITSKKKTRIYNLRLGIMRFENSGIIAFIDTTNTEYMLYNVPGNTQYTLQYGDGTSDGVCNVADGVTCTLFHICPSWGYKLVEAKADNGTFVELDNLNVTCENPIVNVTANTPPTRAIPDGHVDCTLSLEPGALPLPVLHCDIQMGDPIERQSLRDTQSVTDASPYVFDFNYIAIGRHGISIHCWNLINETHLEKQITVTNKNFLFLGVFDRFYSQREGPLHISAMLDTEIFSRLEIIANTTEKSHYNSWNLYDAVHITNNPVMGPEAGLSRQSLLFNRGLFEGGKYQALLKVGFVGEDDNYIYEPTYVQFDMPPLHADIVGNSRRQVNRGDVEVDASISYDPVMPSRALLYTWNCYSFDAASFEDARLVVNGTACSTSGGADGVLTVDTDPVSQHHYFTTELMVNVSGSERYGTYKQTMQIFSSGILNITCKVNCLSKVAISSTLQLVADLADNCPNIYLAWTLTKKEAGTYSTAIHLGELITETGNSRRSLKIRPFSLDAGSWYLVSLSVTLNGKVYGPAYYEFLTNQPPQGGYCMAIPYDQFFFPISSRELVNDTADPAAETKVVAVDDSFNITCSGWKDEGFSEYNFNTDEPLFYYFFTSYHDGSQRQIVYFDPGATSNLVGLQAGDPDDGYRAILSVRICDVFGDYAEIKYNIISKPWLTTANLTSINSNQQLEIVKNFIEQYDEDMIKANTTDDYRTLSRRIMDITSVYNNLKLNISAGIILTPEDLLSLGYQRSESGQLLSWNEYWNLIVDVVDSKAANFLVLTGEKYAQMLYSTLLTWPEDKRMTLVSIETISRALNATLSKLEYSNVTAAVIASRCANILARNLAAHVDLNDPLFPNTEELLSAAWGVRDLIQNVLANLQTVLTPNLPQDPTVDEMRKYLEYVQIFKEAENTLIQPLSLQEQTFLAQKQLQKYYVQKYIKSEKSQIALPLVTYALRNLTFVLGRMLHVGENEIFLENDYIYISVEVVPAYQLIGSVLRRPRVAVEMTSLLENNPKPCNSSEITVRTFIFKHVPYFWGEFGDRITSYVPVFELDGAILNSDTVTYRLEVEKTVECTSRVPTYEHDNPEKLIYMLFDRQYAEDDLLLFVKPDAEELVYKLYFNKDEKPVIDEGQYIYSTEMQTDKWTKEDGYKLLIKSSEFSATGKIWIALLPLLNLQAGDGNPQALYKPFCANVTSVSCLAWVETRTSSGEIDYMWDKTACEVLRTSSRNETVCECRKHKDSTATTIGTTFYVPYNKIDYQNIPTTSTELGRGAVIMMVIATMSIYLLLIVWAWREDVKDQYKWSYSLLIDNDIADSCFYLIQVFTGMRSGAGTSSKVGFVLVGENGDTGVRILDDDSHIGFERGSVRTFVMSTRRYLGDIICIRIWHDDSGGNNSAWFLNKISVVDFATGTRYVCPSDTWFDYDFGDSRVDRVLNAQPQQEIVSYSEMISYTTAEHHLWLSVFMRPMRSNFSRLQRVSCLLGLIYITMIVCTISMKTPDDINNMQEVVIGPFRFSKENLDAALVSVSLATFVILLVTFFFKNAETLDTHNYYDSPLLRAYRKVNSKARVDPSVVGRRYYPPAEDALQHNYYFLPHFCIYVGWAILLGSVAMTSYLLISFSEEWKLIKSEEWMTAIFVSLFCSALFIEVGKVIIVLLAYIMLCPRAHETTEPYVDIVTLEEIAKHNSATLTIGPQYESVLKTPKIPDEETLMENKIKRIQNHQLLKIVVQLSAYSALLYLIYTISFESRDPRSFDLKDHTEKLFHFTSDVNDLDSYTDWLSGTFIDNYFAQNYFGASYNGTLHKPYAQDLANLRIGPARLRQLRIQPEMCIGPLADGRICHNNYNEKKKETADFCLAWKEPECPVTEKSQFFTSPAWTYTSPSEVWGLPTMATYSTYGSGGYFMKLDVNRDVCIKIFNELIKYNWFDKQTRAVLLEFTMYNIDANLFVYSKYVGEFPEVGGFIPFIDIQVFRLYNDTGSSGNFMLYLQFIFMLLVIAATLKCAYQAFTDAKSFFMSFWNILDIIALIMSYTTIGIYINKIFIMQKTLEVFHDDMNEYVGFENLAFYDFVANTTFAILVFILSVRVSRILGYSGKINEMAAVISNAAADLLGFVLIFGITYFSFVSFGTLLFGKETGKYKDLFSTYGTLTEAIIGKNRLNNILASKPGFAELYYFMFVLFVLFTLVTMAAAILNFSISSVKKDAEAMAPSNIVEVIFDRLSKLLDKLRPSRKRSKVKKKRRDSDTELQYILTDLRLFIRGIQKNKDGSQSHGKAKASDKYKLIPKKH